MVLDGRRLRWKLRQILLDDDQIFFYIELLYFFALTISILMFIVVHLGLFDLVRRVLFILGRIFTQILADRLRLVKLFTLAHALLSLKLARAAPP